MRLLPTIAGLGSLTDDGKYVVAGTTIQWGGSPNWGGVSALTLSEVRDAVTNLYNTGLYEYVGAQQLAGYLNPYYQVTVRTAIDRARLRDVIDDIEHALYEAGAQPGTNAYIVVSSPAATGTNTATAGAGNYQQTGNTGGAGNEQVNTVNPHCPNGQFDSLFCGCGKAWSWFPPGCYPADANGNTSNTNKLAAELGITPTSAAVLGIVGALLGVIVIGRVIK